MPTEPHAPSPPPDAGNSDFDAILAQPSALPVSPNAPRSNEIVGAPSTSGATLLVDGQRPSRLPDFDEGWALYRDPVLCGVLAGAGLGALGVFVLLRRAVFVTATLSQAAGLGVALAFFLDIRFGLRVSPVLGALVASVLATLLVGLRSSARISRETLVGMAFVATSALAILVGDRIAQEAHDIAAILFGTAVLVRPVDLWFVMGGTALALLALALLARALTFTGFDAEGARVQGLPVRAIESSFWAVFAIEVSVSTRALGSLPVFAFAVLPAAAGLFLANRLRTAVAIAIVAGALSGALGYFAAFFGELPVGAAQAATAAVLALAAAFLSRFRA